MKKRSKFYSIIALFFILAAGVAAYFYIPQYFADEVYPLDYAPLITQYSEKYSVDPALVAAVILQESRFNPKAHSAAGAQGLMQFMPSTAATMAKETGRWPKYDIYDPETSIEFGAAHLRDLLAKYNGNVDAALAAYNAGTGNADSWVRRNILDRIPFRQTNNYVKKVKNYRTVYASMYAKELKTNPIVIEMNKQDRRGFVWGQIFTDFGGYFEK